MLVTKSGFSEILKEIAIDSTLAIDCETTGIDLYKSDRLFAIIIATSKREYYFNYNPNSICDPDCLLESSTFGPIEDLLNSRLLLIGHNIKFDLTALHKSGITVKTHLWDTMIGARIEWNEHLKYSLAECAKRIGMEKSDAVENYITENRLYSHHQTALKKKIKTKYYDRVPLSIMQPYAEKDARLAYELFKQQSKAIHEMDNVAHAPSMMNVVMNEMKLLHTVHRMEKIGVKIDGDYARRGLEYERAKYEKAAQDFKELSGVEFTDSNKSIAEVFERLGITVTTRTEKGAASFTDSSLRGIENPVAKVILEYREHYKKATFYQGLIDASDTDWTIHPNFKQGGTATGRFSCDSPNLQQIPKQSDEEYSVRGAFVPRDNFTFVEFDYQAMEYRLFADYAGEQELIGKINAGHDVHQATADIIGQDRRTAKTVNFLLLYGGGAAKLGSQLGISQEMAKGLRAQYFAALPKISALIRKSYNEAERRGWIFNWYGRRLRFPNPDFAYKACNYLIQGGCADVVKVAMNKCDDLLKDKKSRMIIQVHDSLLFEIHDEEKFLITQIAEILESVWSGKIRLTTSVAYSRKSWADMVDGIPQ